MWTNNHRGGFLWFAAFTVGADSSKETSFISQAKAAKNQPQHHACLFQKMKSCNVHCTYTLPISQPTAVDFIVGELASDRMRVCVRAFTILILLQKRHYVERYHDSVRWAIITLLTHFYLKLGHIQPRISCDQRLRICNLFKRRRHDSFFVIN